MIKDMDTDLIVHTLVEKSGAAAETGRRTTLIRHDSQGSNNCAGGGLDA